MTHHPAGTSTHVVDLTDEEILGIDGPRWFVRAILTGKVTASGPTAASVECHRGWGCRCARRPPTPRSFSS